MSTALSESPSVDRHARRKAESRRRLLAAARVLFVERGYHATRPQDIARAADVANGTFYLHFSDKREVFHAFAEEASREILDAIRARAQGREGFQALFSAVLEAVFDYSDANPGVLAAAVVDPKVLGSNGMGSESLADRLARAFAGYLRQGVERGELRADYDADVIGHAVIGMISRAASYTGRTGGDRRALISNLTVFLGRALVAPSEEATDA